MIQLEQNFGKRVKHTLQLKVIAKTSPLTSNIPNMAFSMQPIPFTLLEMIDFVSPKQIGQILVCSK